MNVINSGLWLKEPRVVCGVMTGTSLDGVDVAIAKFKTQETKHQFVVLAYKTYEFPKKLKALLLEILEKPVEINKVSYLNFRLSELYVHSIEELCNISVIPLFSIDAIGFHGQTLWHEPNTKEPSTLQLASGSALANLSGITTVSDFRSADVALGGQGAPLIPIFDYEFLRSEEKSRIALNIGGMSNITWLPAGCNKKDVIAFDTGPGNVWIDLAMMKYFGKPYDKDGSLGFTGSLHEEFFAKLRQIEYITQKYPKSTGRELFSIGYLNNILDNLSNLFNPKDIIYTLTYFTSWSISENIRMFFDEKAELIVSGGGSENKLLMHLLSLELHVPSIIKTDDLGIPSDAKEALCFAYLTWLTLGGNTGNLPKVTGASKEAILGSISVV